MRLLLLGAAIAGLTLATATAQERATDVRQFAAVGDGKTLDTAALQRAIDDAANRGGGRVVLSHGVFLSGALRLKSHVEMVIETGAVLRAVADTSKFPPIQSPEWSRMDVTPWPAFLYAQDADEITLTGGGTIDGSGEAGCFQTGKDNDAHRPYGLFFVRCRNVTVRDLNLRNSAFWMERYLACEHVKLHGLRVWNHANLNNDGADIDGCDDVQISDCEIDSMDDAFCLKSEGNRPTRNVTITNCIAATHASAFKLGTGSRGGFENIVISNCIVRRSRATVMRHPLKAWGGLAAIDISSVDGGAVRNIGISNLAVDGVETPIFIKLGNRMSTDVASNYDASAKPADTRPPGTIDGVTISGLRAINVGPIASAIVGFADHPVRNIVLRDISITAARPGTAADLSAKPEWAPNRYPCNRVFGTNLPAYGLVLRDVAGVSLEHMTFTPAATDPRPATWTERATNVTGLSRP